MYCPTCGAQIPDESVFCRNCGAPIPKRRAAEDLFEEEDAPVNAKPATPEIFTNLLKTVKAFFSPKPDEGIHVAGNSNTFEWAILIGLNILVFAFAYAVNVRQIFGSALSSLVGSSLGSFGSDLLGDSLFNFGFFLLFGFLISLLANGAVFGAYFLLEKVIHRGEQNLFGILNTVAYSTIPFTLICLLNMLLGLIWGPLVIPFALIAALAQVYLLHTALKKNAKGGRVSSLAFIGVSLVALLVTFLFGYLLFKAGLSASTNSMMNSYKNYFGL